VKCSTILDLRKSKSAPGEKPTPQSANGPENEARTAEFNEPSA